MSETPLGRFCWYELLTTDVEGAQDFYGRIVGWKTRAWQGEGTPYTTWMNEGAPIGGVMALPEDVRARGIPPHWMPYISTPDVEATAAKAADLGGVLHHRFDLPEIGRLAIAADPGGAVFTAFEPVGVTPGHDGPPALGECSWHELISTDREASWAFYSALFGWEKTEQMDMGGHAAGRNDDAERGDAAAFLVPLHARARCTRVRGGDRGDRRDDRDEADEGPGQQRVHPARRRPAGRRLRPAQHLVAGRVRSRGGHGGMRARPVYASRSSDRPGGDPRISDRMTARASGG